MLESCADAEPKRSARVENRNKLVSGNECPMMATQSDEGEAGESPLSVPSPASSTCVELPTINKAMEIAQPDSALSRAVLPRQRLIVEVIELFPTDPTQCLRFPQIRSL